MTRQKGDPDRRGMGAESDGISEKFVPSAHYKAQQRAAARTLIAAGLTPNQIANMLFVPLEFLSEGNAISEDLPPVEDRKPGT